MLRLVFSVARAQFTESPLGMQGITLLNTKTDTKEGCPPGQFKNMHTSKLKVCVLELPTKKCV